MQTMERIHAELHPSQKPQKPEARSQKPKARSQKPEAKSQKPKARSQKPEAKAGQNNSPPKKSQKNTTPLFI